MAACKKPAGFRAAITRKTMMTSKLKKDMAALKEMVVELTRATRASKSRGSILPLMSSNVLYDMSICSTRSSLSSWEPCASLRKYLDEQQLCAGGPKDDDDSVSEGSVVQSAMEACAPSPKPATLQQHPIARCKTRRILENQARWSTGTSSPSWWSGTDE